MHVRFWGVRGSYPVPGSRTCRYGGHTACVQVCPDDGTLIIIDAGTGLRQLGQTLVADPDGAAASGRANCHLLISHTHWDHIQGLPFFAPLHVPGNHLQIYGHQRKAHLSEIFNNQTRDPYFPVSMDDVGATVRYSELVEGSGFEIGQCFVRCARLNHPYIAVGYRIETGESSVAYVSDTAPFERIVLGYEFVSKRPDLAEAPNGQEAATLAAMRAGVVELCRNVDIMIYDTMFELSEYQQFPHWGHSAPEHALEIAQEANARCLALYHHHPNRSDDEQDAIVARVGELAKAEAPRLAIVGAKEGMTVDCGDLSMTVDCGDLSACEDDCAPAPEGDAS
jgi:phosphoribosyl 1,2-cyclic phosphodiesterase